MVFRNRPLEILLAVFILMLFVVGWIIGPLPQPESYHHFADQRSFFGIPNAWNVLSNIPFALAGIWGIFILVSPDKAEFTDDRERWPWMGVSIGLILTAIGSSYYHLAPDNSRLVEDRLAMMVVFMSLAAALITEKINIKWGLWLFPLLLFIGFFSVFHWNAGEQQGAGDLRLYLSLQIMTAFFVLMMIRVPSYYNRSGDLAIVVLLFGLARLFEIYDHEIAKLTESWISGHTLKHLAGALAGFWLIRMISKRKMILQLKRRE